SGGRREGKAPGQRIAQGKSSVPPPQRGRGWGGGAGLSRNMYDPRSMASPSVTDAPELPPRPLICGCCHAGRLSSARFATHRGQRREAPASAHGRPAGAETREPVPATGVRGYSPPPPPVSPIKGLIDFHTHAAPDVFGRAVDDDELATLAASRQMEAVVFKSHVTMTADRAWLARKHVPGVKIFGGVTLNLAVGGLNPQAVEWMWRMQGGYGRVVWFPTFDADNHVRRAGTAPAGIRVVDERGEILPAVR